VCDMPGGRSAKENVTNRKKQRKIKNRSQTGVNSVPILFSTGKKRSNKGIGIEHFTDRSQVRINPPQARVPFLPESARNIRESIHPQPVQPGRLDPPDGILQEVFCDAGILGIEVRKNTEKPTVGNVSAHRSRGMRISKYFEGIIFYRR